MLTSVMKKVTGSKIEQATDASTLPSGKIESPAAAPEEMPKVGMVMDASEFSFGILPIGDVPRFPYSRPEFLFLTTDDEISVSGDQTTRPVLVPKDPQKMLMFAGYAETINAGKTELNEDHACCKLLSINTLLSNNDTKGSKLSRSVVRKKRTRSVEVSGENNSMPTNVSIRRMSDEDLLAADLMNKSSIGPIGSNCQSKDIEAVSSNGCKVEANYFAIFDGHAGTGAALEASNCLHEHIKERLSAVIGQILQLDELEESERLKSTQFDSSTASSSRTKKYIDLPNQFNNSLCFGRKITKDSLVIGALENAFVDMDDQIQDEKIMWRIPGGTAAIVALFFMGKLYIANAGDCRAILCLQSKIEVLSNDFTPGYERQRLQSLAYKQPDLLGKSFTRLEYDRPLTRKDLKKKVLVRDWYMSGWCQKTVRDTDLRPTMINYNHRKCRLLNTIGVTRGFGDHHLITVDDNLPIKPFLTSVPEVKFFDLFSLDNLTDRDVLIMASDGLWDVMSNEEASNIVQASLSQNTEYDWTKYTFAAQDLIIAARGQPCKEGKRWKGLEEGGKASTDDITVFVIPLKFSLNSALNDEDDVELLR